MFAIARKGKMIVEEINSKYLNETMQLKVYKPENFSTLYKYHICIMQDGDDYFQMGRVATLSDRLHSDQSITNTVFAGIHYEDKYDRRKKYHPDGEQHEVYVKFLAHEVVPLLDEIIPTHHMGQSRTLLGDSLAGTLALMTAIKYPNTFGRVIMQSPYVNETVLNAVKQTSSLEAIDIYHTIGTKETAVEALEGTLDFLTPNRDLNKLLLEKNTSYVYDELDDGAHTWKYWQKDLPNVLKAMFE